MRNPEDRTLTVNIGLLEEVKDTILKYPDNFDMSSWSGCNSGNGKFANYDPATSRQPECGSGCCIAGWTCVIAEKVSLGKLIRKGFGIQNLAQKHLGITHNQSFDLFYYKADHENLSSLTPREAAAKIDSFINYVKENQ